MNETILIIAGVVGIAVGIVMIITFFEIASDVKKIRQHLEKKEK